MRRLLIDNAGQDRVAVKRRIRKNVILGILQKHDALSFTEISHQTKFSLPVVSDLVKELIQEGFVQPVETRPVKIGRPPEMVKINPHARYIIGIDIGRVTTNLVLIDMKREVVAELEVDTIAVRDEPKIFDAIEHEVRQLIKHAAIPDEKILGIGVAIPGLVDSKTGRSYTYLNASEKAVRDILEERLGKPVAIENDAKAMALGEKYFGAAQDVQHALVLNLGWGIGMGIILNGEIYYGSRGFSGEVGHIRVMDNGYLCECGKQGCLESVASGRAIQRIAQDRLKAGAKSKLLEMNPGNLESITVANIVEAACAGDQFSIELLEEAGKAIGEVIAYLINLFNPEKIILGGRVSNAGRFILYPIQTAAFRYSLIELQREISIEISRLGARSGALGATALISRQIFETQHLDLAAYV